MINKKLLSILLLTVVGAQAVFTPEPIKEITDKSPAKIVGGRRVASKKGPRKKQKTSVKPMGVVAALHGMTINQQLLEGAQEDTEKELEKQRALQGSKRKHKKKQKSPKQQKNPLPRNNNNTFQGKRGIYGPSSSVLKALNKRNNTTD